VSSSPIFDFLAFLVSIYTKNVRNLPVYVSGFFFMALDEFVSVLALCSIGSANLVAAVRQLQVLRNLLVGEKQAFQLSQRLGECEKKISERG